MILVMLARCQGSKAELLENRLSASWTRASTPSGSSVLCRISSFKDSYSHLNLSYLRRSCGPLAAVANLVSAAS